MTCCLTRLLQIWYTATSVQGLLVYSKRPQHSLHVIRNYYGSRFSKSVREKSGALLKYKVRIRIFMLRMSENIHITWMACMFDFGRKHRTSIRYLQFSMLWNLVKSSSASALPWLCLSWESSLAFFCQPSQATNSQVHMQDTWPK